MFTTSFRDTVLGTIGGFIGLIKVVTDFRAGTVTIPTYTGYDGNAKPAVTWGAAGATSPASGRQRANSGAVTFPQNTGGNEDLYAWGVYSAATTGATLQMIGFLDADPPIFATIIAATEVFESLAHGLEANQRVFVLAAPGAPLPAGGIAENTAYFVGTVPSADTFTLSTTTANANPLAITGGTTIAGCILCMPYKAVTVATNATPEFAIGALVVQI